MNRLAIFVEGQTEMIFVDLLLREIANANQLQLELVKASGGTRAPFQFKSVQLKGGTVATHYVQIVDCASDGNVKPYIIERYNNLSQQNFWAAIGIRDVYPRIASAQIPSLRVGLANQVPTHPVNVQFILGIMEIEAWFIAEHEHFRRIDASLTNQKILTEIGFDPSMADIQQRLNPAMDLHNIYQIVGLSYRKRLSHCLRTVQNLDYARIYCDVLNRFPDLMNLITIINDFLALPFPAP